MMMHGLRNIINDYDSLHSSMLCVICRGQLKCDGTRAENRFRLSTKRVHLNPRGLQFSRLLAAEVCTSAAIMVVMLTRYPLHSPVFLSLPLPCVTVCHHISTGLYYHFLPARNVFMVFMMVSPLTEIK